jgi:hypothetical protein
MMTARDSPTDAVHETATHNKRYHLWIDGVGAYLLTCANEVAVGGPQGDDGAVAVRLLANLSRRHATFRRTGESYVLDAHGRVSVSGMVVNDRTILGTTSEIELGRGVKLRFRMPSALSATAVVDFLSDHRPELSVDGVVLMDRTLLLGPGTGSHVCCRDWSADVVVHAGEAPDTFQVRSRSALLVDGEIVHDGGDLPVGAVVTGPDFRFRLEAVD